MLTNEIKLWLAGELGIEDARIQGFDVCYGLHETDFSRTYQHTFTPETDTPEGAWWREKIVEWLGNGIYSIAIIPETDAGTWCFMDCLEGNPCVGEFITPQQALFAAVQWVWEQEK